MYSKAKTVDEYLKSLPDDRREVMNRLHETIKKNLPDGFESIMNYGMISYVVPHTIYPAGYHCKPSDPLPFMAIASQKNYISIYHMGVYMESGLMDWLKTELSKLKDFKGDFGKSCLRFKKPEQVPVSLIGKLASKMSVKKWVKLYESKIKPSGKKA